MNESIRALVGQLSYDVEDGTGAMVMVSRDEIRAIIKALKPLAGGTHVMVPVEPTEAMIEAGVKDHRHEQSYAGAEETYRAMLAAVPAAIRSLKTKEQT